MKMMHCYVTRLTKNRRPPPPHHTHNVTGKQGLKQKHYKLKQQTETVTLQ